MELEKELEQFRQEAQRLKAGRQGGLLPFLQALRAFAVPYAPHTLEAGGTVVEAAQGLGVSAPKLYEWRKGRMPGRARAMSAEKSLALVPVRVAERAVASAGAGGAAGGVGVALRLANAAVTAGGHHVQRRGRTQPRPGARGTGGDPRGCGSLQSGFAGASCCRSFSKGVRHRRGGLGDEREVQAVQEARQERMGGGHHTTQRYMHLSPAAKDAAIGLLYEAASRISGDILETEIAPKEKPRR